MIRNHGHRIHRRVLRGALPRYHSHYLLCPYSLLMLWNPYHLPRPSHTDNPRLPSFRAHHQGNLSLQDQRYIVHPASLALARYSRHPIKIRGHCSHPAHPASLDLSPKLCLLRVPPPCFTTLARGNRPGRAYRRHCGHRSAIPLIIRRPGARAVVEFRRSCRRTRSFVRPRHRRGWERGHFCYLRPHPALFGRRTYKIRCTPRFWEVQFQPLLKILGP